MTESNEEISWTARDCHEEEGEGGEDIDNSKEVYVWRTFGRGNRP